MSWKARYPRVYRFLAKCRFASAREKIIDLPFKARMRVNPYSFSERLIENGDFEKWRVEFFQSTISSRSVFFDIGANVGFFSLLAAKQGATVHAFEPEPLNLSRLQGNLQLNPDLAPKIKIWPVALGDKAGEVDFGRPLSDNYGHSSLLLDEGFDRIRVRMERFADLDFGSFDERFFKIDVEGAEQLVLEGFGEAWDSPATTVFLVEVHRQYGADLDAIVKIFASRGFRLSFMDESHGGETEFVPDGGDVALLARK
ncbi:MAG: FkbM family methyltransferase [Verrucomicrobia bacterium]|nr:FkbM family methyltransferase [Verrucomicrobiota bacterium]